MPDDEQSGPGHVGQNPGELVPEDDHSPHDPSESHRKPPSDAFVAWSIVVAAVAAVITVVLTGVLVLFAP